MECWMQVHVPFGMQYSSLGNLSLPNCECVYYLLCAMCVASDATVTKFLSFIPPILILMCILSLRLSLPLHTNEPPGDRCITNANLWLWGSSKSVQQSFTKADLCETTSKEWVSEWARSTKEPGKYQGRPRYTNKRHVRGGGEKFRHPDACKN